MKIRPRVNPSGEVVFQLDLGMLEGKRVRRTFESMTEAQAELRRERQKRKIHGRRSQVIEPEVMTELLAARQRLRASGATVMEAVEFFLQHATRLREEVTVAELVRRFRADRESRGCSEFYVRQLKTSLGHLVRMFGERKAHAITAVDVEVWLRANGWKGKTHNNYLGDVAAMFAWAASRSRGLVQVNPTLEVERAKWTRRGAVVLSVERCDELLREARRRELWRVLSYVVLGMFAGIRPEETKRLSWGAVDLNEGTVVVMATDAKTAARRVIDLSENARAWLRLVPVELRGAWMRIVPKTNWNDEWLLFRRALGWDVGHGAKKHLPAPTVKAVHGRWPHDVLRHSFASYHYAMWQDEQRLQVQMGHRSARMLHQHYRAVVTRAEAVRFWGLIPG